MSEGAEHVVELQAGPAAGRLRDDGLLVLRGVPYGAPPVGPRRLAPPQPATWTGVLDATVPAPSAPQPDRPVSHRFHGPMPPSAEDCLRVDVVAPAGGAPRPAVVWLHGGGFTVGSPGAELFDPAALARTLDAVVVMVGHRLGSAGWLRHPELAGPGGEEGNWGLLDQAAALRWVHDHADVLGVDPARVVLAGESAGGGAALLHLAAPASRGLLAGVVALSPPLGELVVDRDRAVSWAQDLAAAHATAVAGLRDVSAADLVTAHEALLADPRWAGTRGGALPSLDLATAPSGPLDDPAAAAGVDALVTTNRDEGTFFFRQPGREARPDAEGLARIVGAMPGVDDAAAVLAHARERLGTDDGNELLVRLATERIFTEPLARWERARTAAGGHVERREITHRSRQPGLGATHSIGVPLLFGTWATTATGAWIAGAPGAEQAAAELQAAVRAFVHAGGRSMP